MDVGPRTNVVLITTDTQGREMVSPYVSRPGVETPELDRMAAEGVVFKNAFTTCPLCTPARGSWYTGLHPGRHGAVGNELGVSRKVPLLAEILSDAGYAVHHIGKWHLDAAGYNGAGTADGGFSGDTWYDLSNFYDEVGRDGPNRFGGWNRGLYDKEYCYGHRVADRAIKFLTSGERGKPFFLAVEFDEPHGPYICPPPYRDRFAASDIYSPPGRNADLTAKPELQQRYAAYLRSTRTNPEEIAGYYAKYYNCNSYVDYEIGRVLEAVRRDEREDTIVIFTSDHGDHLGAFGLGAKGPTMYDHTIRVPLIVWSPRIRGGRRVASLVSSVDVWATILDFAGCSDFLSGLCVSDGYEAYSVLPLIDADDQPVSGTCDQSKRSPESGAREAVFVEYNRFGIQFDQCNGFFPIRCVRTERWKLAINLFDRDELYDTREDPEEIVNRIDDKGLRTVRNELHDRLLEWQQATQDLLRGPVWLRRPWRHDARHDFVGFTTTGFTDQWEGWEWPK